MKYSLTRMQSKQTRARANELHVRTTNDSNKNPRNHSKQNTHSFQCTQVAMYT